MNKTIALFYKKVSSYGGQEKFLLKFAQNLKQKGFSPVFFCQKNEVDTPFPVHRLFYIPYPSWLKMLSFALSSYIITKNLQKKNVLTIGFGKVFGQNIYRAGGGIHKKYVKQSLLRWRNKNVRFFYRLKRFFSLYHWFSLFVEHLAFTNQKTVFIVPSNIVKEDLINYFGIDGKRIHLVYNPVDIKRFSPHLKDNHKFKFTFVFVSTNHLLKGLDYLIDAFKTASDRDEDFLKNAELVVAGSGNEDYFFRKIKRHNLRNIKILGKVKDIENVYRMGDVFFYPTLYDASGNVILEAMASSLPCIVSKFAGYANLIEESNCGDVIDDPTDIEKMSQMLLHYFYLPREKLKSMGKKGRDFVIHNSGGNWNAKQSFVIQHLNDTCIEDVLFHIH